jgi:hypothetical protein
VAFVVLWDVPEPLRAHVASDAHGPDRLEFLCDDCPKGSTVTYGKETAEFEGESAILALEKPLKIGNNELIVSLERPGIGRDEAIELTVPVQYRVWTDLSGLRGPGPKLSVVVEAKPEAKVEVDGKAVQLADGKGTQVLDVSEDLTGAAKIVERLSREIPYVVSVGGSKHRGKLEVDYPIVPLVVDAPAKGWITDETTVKVAGSTAAGARVVIDDGEIEADSNGRFEQTIALSSVGTRDVPIRAQAESHAPRQLSVSLQRVESLRDEAKKRRSEAKTSYAQALEAAQNVQRAAERDPDTQGEGKDVQVAQETPEPTNGSVALRGIVKKSRVNNGTTVLLLDVRKGCSKAPCLARVIASQPLELKPDAKLEVFGNVTSTVKSPFGEEPLPVIEAAFVLR